MKSLNPHELKRLAVEGAVVLLVLWLLGWTLVGFMQSKARARR